MRAEQQASPPADAPPRLSHWIGGRAVPGEGTRSGDVFDPSAGTRIRQVPFASAADVNAAVAAAAAASPAWSRTPPVVRARVLFRFRELAEARADVLSRLITSEHGKILSDARGELARGMEVVEFACGIPQLLKGEISEQVGRGIDIGRTCERDLASPRTGRRIEHVAQAVALAARRAPGDPVTEAGRARVPRNGSRGLSAHDPDPWRLVSSRAAASRP